MKVSFKAPTGALGAGSTPGVNQLEMQTTAKTFRYLDQEEIAAQRKAAVDAKKGAKK